MKDIKYLYGWWGSTLKVQIQLNGNGIDEQLPYQFR